jgi:hypothetical protein
MIAQYLQPLVIYTTRPDLPLAAGPVAYPPLFAWLFTPFTLVPPPLGFALWTALQIGGAVGLAWRVRQLVGHRDWGWAVLLLLTSVPVFQSLFIGHPMTLMAWALGEGFLALRRGHDLRAGLWLSCLLLKPQYILLLGPYLLWKRQWAAVAGIAAGAAVVVLGSIAVAGISTLAAYPAVLRDMASFRDVGGNTQPEAMANWRAVVLALAPRISETRGIATTLLLGIATTAAAALALRGPWLPGSQRFAASVTVVILVTLLANYHSHGYGAVLVTVPLAAALGDARTPPWVRITVIGAWFGLAIWTAAHILWPQIAGAAWPILAVMLGGQLSVFLTSLWWPVPVRRGAAGAPPDPHPEMHDAPTPDAAGRCRPQSAPCVETVPTADAPALSTRL